MPWPGGQRMNLLSIGLIAGLAATLGMTALKTPAAALLRPDTVFRLENAGGRVNCVVRKGRTLSDGWSELLPGPDCATIFAPLADAVVWREGEDGTVDFIGRGGRTLVRFALADGAGYESIRPRSKILSLIAER